MKMAKIISDLNTELSNAMRALNEENVAKKSISQKNETNAIKGARKNVMDSKEYYRTKPEINVPKWSASRNDVLDSDDISTGNLQEAVIWSEILGKPVSKRRKSR